MYRFGRVQWLVNRLAAASVAAVCATGFGLLATPPAHAGLDALVVSDDGRACLVEPCH